MKTHQLQPGQELSFYIQKGFRPGRVLAVIGQEALIEYTMPELTTSLMFVSIDVILEDEHTVGSYERSRNPYGYERIPLKWLKRMVENKIDWIGLSQAGPIMSAKELLERRTNGSGSRPGWIDYHTRHEREFRKRQICIQVEVWGWTILIDGEVLGHLRKGLATLAMAKSLAVRACAKIPQKEEV